LHLTPLAISGRGEPTTPYRLRPLLSAFQHFSISAFQHFSISAFQHFSISAFSSPPLLSAFQYFSISAFTQIMPLPFYLSCLMIVVFGLHAWSERRRGWGLPAGMVLATVSAWYVGDVLYNEVDVYLELIGAASIASAWWQVLWFVLAFGLLVKPVHEAINARLRGQRSHVMEYLESNRLLRKEVQHQIDVLGGALLVAWLVLMGIALVKVEGNTIGLFAPYLGMKAEPWARGQIGGGFSALISFASYLQIFLAAAFGVLAAMALNPKTRNMALLICALTLPYYIFDRTRNTMLATVMPGVLVFVFVRLRSSLPTKVMVLGGCFLVVNFWFSNVMANRQGMSFDIAGALSGNQEKGQEKAKHAGLNMLEELAWIDHFTETGAYLPNMGERYFAEAMNPIPRTLWKNKPMIGLDYAVARGQAAVGPNGETTATISTGMIGQGVVNFGRFFGPLAAAVLMSLWVALLARQDLLGANPGRLVLYGTGLILTFNMGRDITLLVIYPFLFGLGLFHIWEWWQRSGKQRGGRKRQAGKNLRRIRQQG
jgi:predicted outer membrane lipoprotein